MDQRYKALIAEEFADCVTDTIERLKGEDTNRPFHAALLSEDAIFWARFERSFSTSFGQRVIEKISEYVIKSNGGNNVTRQKETSFDIDTAFHSGIDSFVENVRSRKTPKDWNSATAYLSTVKPNNVTTRVRIISDLYWEKDGVKHYASIKTVKPNIDQTLVAKKDMMTLYVLDNTSKVYYGLYYNPYGENKSDYKHNPPMGIFDFHGDAVVLIGKEYWDTLGGVGCYEEVLAIAEEVGLITRPQIEALK